MKPELDISASVTVNLQALKALELDLETFSTLLADKVAFDAKQRTPVRTGVLRSSGHVRSADRSGFIVSFGGPAAPYALYVHENLRARHRVGEAKFLEKAMAQVEKFAKELLK